MKNQFITYPNLPENRISLAAVGNYPEIKNALLQEGIETVSFINNSLTQEISRHQDMLLCHSGGENIFIEPMQDKEVLENKGFTVNYSQRLGSAYPFDVKLNAAISKDFFICNKKTVDASLYEALIKSDKRCIHVNQGYTKCSVCFVNENAVITEDSAIAQILTENSIDVLLISKGDIYLSESHYGFFGGSTGKIDKNTLAITGELKYHRDEEKILGFLNKHGVKLKELTKEKIIDIGGILPLMY